MKFIPPILTGLATAGLAVVVPVMGAEASGPGARPTVSQSPPPQTLSVLTAQVEPAAAARISAIPEPMSLAVFGTGILLLLRRRRF